MNVIMLYGVAEFPTSTFMIQYFSFPLLFSFIIFHNFTICTSDLFLCFTILIVIAFSWFCILVIPFFIFARLVFISFISAERDFVVSSMLFSSPASILMIFVLNPGSDILLTCYLYLAMTSSSSFGMNSPILAFCPDLCLLCVRKTC